MKYKINITRDSKVLLFFN